MLPAKRLAYSAIIDRPPLKLPGGGAFHLGAANQVAVARTSGYSYGASGAVANSGGAALGGNDKAYPAGAKIGETVLGAGERLVHFRRRAAELEREPRAVEQVVRRDAVRAAAEARLSSASACFRSDAYARMARSAVAGSFT